MLFLITQHCDMGCPHCMSDSTPDSPHASKKTVDAFIKFAKKLDVIKIGISGGEPTSHPNFYDHFSKIVFEFRRSYIVLMSNGSFLRDEYLTRRLAGLQALQDHFHIQISSIPGLYRDYDEIVQLYEQEHKSFINIQFIDQLYYLEERLGRAAKNDLAKHRTGNQRIAPGCYNLYATCHAVGSLKKAINTLDTQSMTTLCKPMIDATGNIHPGESIDCPIVGNLHKSSLTQIHRALATGQPCGACGNEVPAQFKFQLER